jgi:hypothetical protein
VNDNEMKIVRHSAVYAIDKLLRISTLRKKKKKEKKGKKNEKAGA